MALLTYVVTNVVYFAISVLQLLMLARAILSWIPMDEDNALVTVIYHVTEMVIFPVRSILERFETIAMLPIDVSFFVTFILLSLLQEIIAQL